MEIVTDQKKMPLQIPMLQLFPPALTWQELEAHGNRPEEQVIINASICEVDATAFLAKTDTAASGCKESL